MTSQSRLNMSSVIKNASTIQIDDQQLLESEEHFETGKVMLSDKKYKEALKAFSKCL